MPQWCRAPCLKAVQGKRVRDFHAFSSSGLSLSRVIIHSRRRVRDDAPMTFPPPPHRYLPTPHQPATSSRFVVTDPKQKGLSESNICCFPPELPQPSVTISQAAKNISERSHRALASPTPPLLTQFTDTQVRATNVKQRALWTRTQRETWQRGFNFLRVMEKSLGWLFYDGRVWKTEEGWKKIYISLHVPPKKSHFIPFITC